MKLLLIGIHPSIPQTSEHLLWFKSISKRGSPGHSQQAHCRNHTYQLGEHGDRIHALLVGCRVNVNPVMRFLEAALVILEIQITKGCIQA